MKTHDGASHPALSNITQDTVAVPGDSPARSPQVQATHRLVERSIFHQPWWLDITCSGGQWDVVSIADGDGVVAEMPYMTQRKGPWLISIQPPLTRTLGPVIRTARSNTTQQWRDRIHTTTELIAKLPQRALFQQVLDTRIGESIAFSMQGFNVSVDYTLTIAPTRDMEDVWKQMRGNTRNLIRRAEERVSVRAIDDPSRFMQFYDGNLAKRKLRNVYGSALMQRLTEEVVRRNAGVLLGAFDDRNELCAAIGLVWDHTTLYYLLSTRDANAHAGCVPLLIWNAIRMARERNLIFDIDGIANESLLTFLSGIGGTPTQRLVVERTRFDFAALRALFHFTADRFR